MTAGKNMPEDNFVKPRKLKRSLVESKKNIKVEEPRDKRRKRKEWLSLRMTAQALPEPMDRGGS